MSIEPQPSSTVDKQAFVADLLRTDPSLTMNKVSNRIKERFGTLLAYPKLRESYVGAGGKIDERRGRRGKRGPRAARASAAPAAGRRNTQEKIAFITEMVSANPDMSMNEVGKHARAKFGTQLAFPILRRAFTAAGGKVGKPGRRPSKDRARVERRQGRRAADVRAAQTRNTLKSMPQHVVIVHTGGDVLPHEFTTFGQAEDFTRGQIENGIALTDIAYYQRQPLKINVGV